MKALCPITHLSDVPRSKISSKFAVGTRIKVRILERDAARRRVTVTHKKTLLNSKLPALVSVDGASVGMVAHGYVTGIEKWGVFVCFYGGCKGLARLADLGLAPDQSPLEAFEMHQVVKVKVLGSESGKHERLQLSLDPGSLSGKATGTKDDDDGADGNLSVGQVVSGKVGPSLPAAGAATLDVLVTIMDNTEGDIKWTRALLEVSHLSDHPGAALALQETLQPGSALGQLVVLEERAGGARWRVSRKASLVEAAESAASKSRLPRELTDLHPGTTHPGYVASVTAAGCFVRFLGRLTGLAPTPQLADTFVTDPKQHYAVGQSVRAQVLEVDLERRRCLFCLKPSQCGGGEAQLLQTLLRDMETAHAIAKQA